MDFDLEEEVMRIAANHYAEEDSRMAKVLDVYRLAALTKMEQAMRYAGALPEGAQVKQAIQTAIVALKSDFVDSKVRLTKEEMAFIDEIMDRLVQRQREGS